MFRESRCLVSLLSLGLAVLAGCSKDGGGLSPTDAGSGGADAAQPGDDAGVTNPPDSGVAVQEFPESSKAIVRFKRNERIRNDFAQALGLTSDRLCNELGRYSCTDYVHNIALGGVEPYTLGVREGSDVTTITAPTAVERVALSGCEQRVTADLADPGSALIFKGLAIDASGALTAPDSPAVRAAISTMYERALTRHARDTEVDHLVALYADVAATGEPAPARDWAILTCFSVLTTMEALFY